MRNKGVLYDITRVNTFEGDKEIAAGEYQHKHSYKNGQGRTRCNGYVSKICVVLDCTLDDIVELGSNTEKGGEK